MSMEKYYVHSSSIVDEGAHIGAGSKIWHFCHVFAGASIGTKCVIGQGCSIAAKAVIGDGCKLQNGISVYDGVTIEDGVFCGPHMVFTNVINPRAFLERKSEYRPTLLRRGCTIGANATILCGVTIGCYALIGAGAVITTDVADYALAYGNPARQHGWVDTAGNKLDFPANGGQIVGSDGKEYLLAEGRVRIANAGELS